MSNKRLKLLLKIGLPVFLIAVLVTTVAVSLGQNSNGILGNNQTANVGLSSKEVKKADTFSPKENISEKIDGSDSTSQDKKAESIDTTKKRDGLLNKIKQRLSPKDGKVSNTNVGTLQENERSLDDMQKKNKTREVKNFNTKLLKNLEQKDITDLNERVTNQSFQTATLEKKRTILEARKNKMLELARTNPGQFLERRLSENTRAELPQSLQGITEQETTVKGDVIHIDRYDGQANEFGKDKDTYMLLGENKSYRLHLPNPNDNYDGQNIEITGTKLGDVIVPIRRRAIGGVVADNSQTAAQRSGGGGGVQVTPTQGSGVTAHGQQQPADGGGNPGERNVAVFMFDFSPGTSDRPFSAQSAHNRIFNGPFNDFMEEQSYGETNFTGNVFGWYSVTSNNSCPSVYPNNNSVAAPYITSSGADLSQYDHILFVVIGRDCDDVIAGKSSMDIENPTLQGQELSIIPSWISGDGNTFLYPFYNNPSQWTSFQATLAHELGHSLGVHHSEYLDCGDKAVSNKPPSSQCSSKEYGNWFDVMGTGRGARHFSAPVKEKLGWLFQSEKRVITQPGSHVVTLHNLEESSRNSSAYQTVQIAPNRNNTHINNQKGVSYYLEYRSATGFDNHGLSSHPWQRNNNGVFVNVVYNNHGHSISPHAPLLVDTKPTTDSTDDQSVVALTKNPVGNMPILFEDTHNGITVTPFNKANKNEATVLVEVQPTSQCNASNLNVMNVDNLDYFQHMNDGRGVVYVDITIGNENHIGCTDGIMYTLESLSHNTNYFDLATDNPINDEIIPWLNNSQDFIYNVMSTPPAGTYTFQYKLTNQETGQTNNFTETVEFPR